MTKIQELKKLVEQLQIITSDEEYLNFVGYQSKWDRDIVDAIDLKRKVKKVTVKELVKVCSSATCIRAYDSVDAMDDGKYFKSYGVLREFAKEYGECEVLAIYPEFKDYLCVAIEVEDEHYHFEDYRFVKKEREQFYKGIKIETIRWYYKGDKDRKKRDYRVTWKNGMVSVWTIEKSHGMKELKNYINVLIESQDNNPLYKSWVG